MDASRPPLSIDASAGEVRRLRWLASILYRVASLRRHTRDGPQEVRRVLHVSPSLFGGDGIVGGAERAAYELARAVAAEIDTTLVSFGPERVSRRDGRLHIEIYPSSGALGGQRFDPLCRAFLQEIPAVDVVHCNQYRVAVSQLAILAGAALGKRTFVTDRGGVGIHFDPRVPVERCLSGLLAISDFSLAHLPADAPQRVIYGGATEFFRSAGGAAAGASPHPDRRALFVGRVMRHKGIDVLIRALPSGVGLDVIGPVGDDEYLQLLMSLSRGRDVRFLDEVSDEQLLNAYRHALVTVLPSVYRDAFGGRWPMPELLGNALLESMACGTPTICSDVGGMPEVVDDGVTGFVVPPSDPAALAARIAELAGDAGLRDKMGKRARARALDRFSWERVAQNTLQAYREARALSPSSRLM